MILRSQNPDKRIAESQDRSIYKRTLQRKNREASFVIVKVGIDSINNSLECDNYFWIISSTVSLLLMGTFKREIEKEKFAPTLSPPVAEWPIF